MGLHRQGLFELKGTCNNTGNVVLRRPLQYSLLSIWYSLTLKSTIAQLIEHMVQLQSTIAQRIEHMVQLYIEEHYSTADSFTLSLLFHLGYVLFLLFYWCIEIHVTYSQWQYEQFLWLFVLWQRLYLAAMHFSENADCPQMTTSKHLNDNIYLSKRQKERTHQCFVSFTKNINFKQYFKMCKETKQRCK